jgi:hypothetical protein
MGFPTKAEVEAKAHAIAFEAECARGREEIYRAYPIIPRNEANNGMIDEICATFLGAGKGEIAPSLSTFRSAVEADPTILGKGHGVAIEPVEMQKRNVLADIEKLLTGIMTPFDLRTEIKKLSFQSLEQVRARREQIVERQRLDKMSVTQIREEQKAAQPKQHRYFPYELLPAEMTADELKKVLRSYRANEFLRRFSAAQLDDRLFGRG